MRTTEEQRLAFECLRLANGDLKEAERMLSWITKGPPPPSWADLESSFKAPRPRSTASSDDISSGFKIDCVGVLADDIVESIRKIARGEIDHATFTGHNVHEVLLRFTLAKRSEEAG